MLTGTATPYLHNGIIPGDYESEFDVSIANHLRDGFKKRNGVIHSFFDQASKTEIWILGGQTRQNQCSNHFI